MKKLTSVLLVFIMVLSFAVTASAAQKNYIADMSLEFGESYSKLSQTDKELVYANSKIGIEEFYLLYVKDYLKGSGIEVTTNNLELLLEDFASMMITPEIYSEMLYRDLQISAECTLEPMNVQTMKNKNGVEVSTKAYNVYFNISPESKDMMFVFVSLIRNGDDIYFINANIMTDFNERIAEYGKVIDSIALTFKDPVLPEEVNPAQQPIKIVVNGEYVFPDSDPVIVNDRTLVPIRAIGEKLGYNVWWNGEKRTAALSNDTVTLAVTIDSMEMVRETQDKNILGNVINEVIPIDVAASIINDRTYLPLRAVGEALGCDVAWDGTTRTVIITSK